MTGFIVNVFPFRNRVSPKEAFEGLELGEGKLSRPVLRGPGGRKAAWLLGDHWLLPRSGLLARSVPEYAITRAAPLKACRALNTILVGSMELS